VEHDIGSSHDFADTGCIVGLGEIEGHVSMSPHVAVRLPIDCRHPIISCDQLGCEMPADETGGTCNDSMHRRDRNNTMAAV
jgi:hypothetical protein